MLEFQPEEVIVKLGIKGVIGGINKSWNCFREGVLGPFQEKARALLSRLCKRQRKGTRV